MTAMKSIYFKSLAWTLLWFRCACAGTTPSSYVAGIVEYFPYAEVDATDNVKKNLEAIEPLVESAAQKGAQIVVFPEYGLTGFLYTSRAPLSKQLEQIPDNPSSERILPCNNSSFNTSPSFQKLSCLALSYRIALVVNTGDKQPCTTHDTQCPPGGFYQYNTNIAFDSDGCYLAKYHKRHLYGGETALYDTPAVEMVSFTTKFGVTFGTFTCFDILFDSPAMELVEKGVKNFIFPTFWGSEFPALVSTAVQQSWSMLTSTSLIAANIHCQDEYCLTLTDMPATGSGIYMNGTVLSNYISGVTFKAGNGVVKTAMVPAEPRQLVANSQVVPKMANDTDILLKFLEGATYKQLDFNSSSASVKDSSGNVSCELHFKFKFKAAEERYAIGAYYGKRSYGMGAFCMLVKCNESGDCGEPVQKASSTFQFLQLVNSFPGNFTVFPFTLGNRFSLLDPQKFTFETNSFTIDGIDEPILAASLWGCDQCS